MINVYQWTNIPECGQIPVKTGTLSHCGLTGRYIFRYARAWLAKGRKFGAIDPFMPLRERPYDLGDECLSAIGDASPGRWGMTILGLLLGKRIGMRRFVIPDTFRPGSLDFAQGRGGPVLLPGPDGGIRKSVMLAVSLDHGLSVEKTKGNILSLLNGFSIGGARPKCVFTDEEGKTFIVKLPKSTDRWADVRIEKAFLVLASLCGIEIPKFRTGKIAGQDALFLERFDRKNDERIPFASASMAFSSLSPGYPGLAVKVREISGNMDARELFLRMIFNVLVRNVEDGPRKHGFLRINGKWRLAPAYGITPIPFALNMARPALHSMSIGGFGNRGTIENALSMCGAFSIQREEAEVMVAKMRETIGKSWRKSFADAKIPENDAKMLVPLFETMR